MTLREALEGIKVVLASSERLASLGLVDTEAEQILCAVMRESRDRPVRRAEMLLSLGQPIAKEGLARALGIAERRSRGEPLQYLIGYQAFLDHEYDVGPGVLVPRPETELLVVNALETLRRKPSPPRLGIEVGLGSGAIAIEILAALPGCRILGSELTDAASRMALSNARRILGEKDGSRLQVLRPESPEQVMEPFAAAGVIDADFLVSNPPYLKRDEAEPDVIAYEPATALFAPEKDALYFYRRIAEGAAEFLRSGAPVMVEIPHERSTDISKLFQKSGWNAKLIQDLNGRDRILIATRQ